MASMYDKIVSVITKPPNERTEREVQPLLPWFKKKASLFRNMKTDVVSDIIRNCEFSSRPRDNIIIKQGERGDCFYVILRGIVSVHIKQTISDEEDESKISASADEELYSAKGELDRTKLGPFIAHLDAGTGFGELALINKNCIRNASIIAHETTDLLVVNRVLYNRSLRASHAADIEEKASFVREHPFFQNWAQKHKKQMVYSLNKEIIFYDSTIIKQGEPTSILYFLRKGQAKLVIDPSHHEIQYPQFYPIEDPDELLLALEEAEEDDGLQLPRHFRKKPVPVAELEKSHSIAPSAMLKKREARKKVVEISHVSGTGTIGDVEFVLELKTYLQTFVCTQTCEVFTLDTRNYERLVSKRNPKTKDLLRQAAEVKLSARISRLHDNQVPLLRTLLFKMECIDRQKQNKGRRRVTRTPISWEDDFVPQRGPLIDMYGPGTVFYRTKMRERAKNIVRNKAQFRGATVGFPMRLSPLPAAVSGHDVSRSQEVAPLHGQNHLMVPGSRFFNQDMVDDEHLLTYRSGSEEEEGEEEDEEGEEEDSDDDGRPKPGVKPVYPTFSDWKSSDRALSVLEDRITAWHSALTDPPTRPKTSKATAPAAVKLRRVTIEDGREVKPGTKVVLRKRRPRGKLGLLYHDDEEDQMNSGQDESPGRNHSPRRLQELLEGPNTVRGDERTETVKETLHTRRVPRAQTTTAESTAVVRLPWYLLKSSRPPQQNGDTHESHQTTDRRHHPGLESSGTILDILKTRQEMVAENIKAYSARADWLPTTAGARRHPSPETHCSSGPLPKLVTSPCSPVMANAENQPKVNSLQETNRLPRTTSSYPPATEKEEAPSLVSLLHCYRKASIASTVST